MTSRPRSGLAKAGQLSDSLDESSTSMKPKPTELPPEQQPPIRFKHNVIAPVGDAGGSRFIPAGEPSPYLSLEEVPANLRPFIVTDDEPEAEEENQANFTLNTVYMMTEDGRRGRMLHRQVAQLETENALRDYVEERLSEAVPREVADALEDQHDAHIGASKARAQYAAEERDQAQEVAQRFIDGEDDPEVNEL